MKTFNILILLTLLLSCTQHPNPKGKGNLKDKDKTEVKETYYKSKNLKYARNIQIIIVDGCEYILYTYRLGSMREGSTMVHKGDCKNIIHKNHNYDK